MRLSGLGTVLLLVALVLVVSAGVAPFLFSLVHQGVDRTFNLAFNLLINAVSGVVLLFIVSAMLALAVKGLAGAINSLMSQVEKVEATLKRHERMHAYSALLALSAGLGFAFLAEACRLAEATTLFSALLAATLVFLISNRLGALSARQGRLWILARILLALWPLAVGWAIYIGARRWSPEPSSVPRQVTWMLALGMLTALVIALTEVIRREKGVPER